MRGEDKVNVHPNYVKDGNPLVTVEYPDYEAPVIDDGKYQGVIGQVV